MVRRNITATTLKMLWKNLHSVKCYDKLNMNVFTLSLWKNFWWGLIYFDQFMTLCHPNMHLHTKFGIPISKNIGICTRINSVLETRSQVNFKVTVTQLWYATLPYLKMQPHTKFEILTSNNI